MLDPARGRLCSAVLLLLAVAAVAGYDLPRHARSPIILCHDAMLSDADFASCVKETLQAADPDDHPPPEFHVFASPGLHCDRPCRLPLEMGTTIEWASLDLAVEECHPANACDAFACADAGCMRVGKHVDWDVMTSESSTYRWNFSIVGTSGVVSIACPDAGTRLYRHVDFTENWDGARLELGRSPYISPESLSAVREMHEFRAARLDSTLDTLVRDGIAAIPVRLFSEDELAAINANCDAYFASVQAESRHDGGAASMPIRALHGVGLLEPPGTPGFSGRSYFLHNIINTGTGHMPTHVCEHTRERAPACRHTRAFEKQAHEAVAAARRSRDGEHCAASCPS
jgi:hypothetical protein